jgi:GntR family transcriptional regulator
MCQAEANSMISAAHAPVRVDQRPLYAQASEALRNLVARGGYAPGDRLPSEIELSQQLGISRPTLREALRLLEEDGSIVRRHGVGTFVAQPRPVIESGLEVLESIERVAERLGLSTSMAEVKIEERAAAHREARALGVEAGAPVTAVTRVISAGGQPVAHLVDVVPQQYLRSDELQGHDAARVPAQDSSASALAEGFHGSVLDYLLARGWPALSHSRTELSAESAGAELAHALGIPRRASVLSLEAQLYAQDGRVVDYSISHFVSGHFRFHVVRRIG